MEMMEYRNSARGHLITLENKGARESYLDETIQGTTKKQKAFRTLVSSEMHAETIESWRVYCGERLYYVTLKKR